MTGRNLNKKQTAQGVNPVWWLMFAVLLGIAAIVAFMGFTGHLNHLFFRPLPLDWVDIPGRVFLMGSIEEDPAAHLDEFPQHLVYLDGYRINRYLVTNQQYAQCVQAGMCEKPSPAIDDPKKAHHPVVKVTWEDAQAFCEWNGGRLPTEAEWEMAARGGLTGALYPWGDEIDCQLANYGDCLGDTSPVDSHAPNGYGLHDMAGNVYEWVADWYDGSYYRYSPEENPGGPAKGENRVIRGGSWGEDQRSMRVALRHWNLPAYPQNFIGFRCAQGTAP